VKRLICCYGLLLLALNLFFPVTHAQAMPPHDRLQEGINKGLVGLPNFMRDPELAVQLGINQPFRLMEPQPVPLTGSIKALVVLVDFSDKVHTVTASFFDSLVFAAPVAGRGSVRDYFSEVSYGQVDIVMVNAPSALGWVRAPQTNSYYTYGGYGTDAPYPNNCQKLAEDIVDAVSGVVNFANYDNNGDGECEPIMIVHAGPGAEYTGSVNDIWSHSWQMRYPRTLNGKIVKKYVIMPEYYATMSSSSSDMGIGVFCHEMGHGFWGVPDLYDRDYTSYGIGNWTLMASGSWNGPARKGESPAWPDAWTRIQMGFVSPTTVATDGNKSIPQALNNPAPAQTVLKLTSDLLGDGEYFLLENRQQVSGAYDEYLPGNGLLIWHVDELMNTYGYGNDYECTNNAPCSCPSQHYLVALQQADGQLHLEKKLNKGDTADPFPGSGVKRAWTGATTPSSGSWYTCQDTGIGATNISNSAAVMTADLTVSGTPPPTVTLNQALDNPTLVFTTGGDRGWFGQTAVYQSGAGASAAQSGLITHSQASWFQTSVTGPNTISFWWKVSSEANYDYLRFYIDGTEQAGKISGNVDWEKKTFTIPAGSHTLKWQYSKDGSVNSGSDCGWVDQVTTPRSSVGPLFLLLN
jgi:immune inhibitor A